MLGYYPNSNAKPRGGNLIIKYKHVFHGLFFINIYVDLHILIQVYITDKHKHTQTYKKHTFTHIHTN